MRTIQKKSICKRGLTPNIPEYFAVVFRDCLWTGILVTDFCQAWLDLG
jgi:hypothetical protein